MAKAVAWLALVVGSGIGQEYSPPEDLFGGGKKECPAFRCPSGQEAAPKRPLKLTSTGSCNGLGGGGMSMFSAQKTDDPLGHCCDVRQVCDQICGTTLKLCNEALETCMNATCALAADKEDCTRSASIHKLMTQLGDGCAKLVPGQNANCQCLSPDRAAKRREQLLTDLYKKHAPDDADKKVRSLLDKATSPKKFATLLAKLVDKYPKTITYKKDPSAAYLENLMKQAKDTKTTTTTASGEDVDDEEDGDLLDLDERPSPAAENSEL